MPWVGLVVALGSDLLYVAQTNHLCSAAFLLRQTKATGTSGLPYSASRRCGPYRIVLPSPVLVCVR